MKALEELEEIRERLHPDDKIVAKLKCCGCDVGCYLIVFESSNDSLVDLTIKRAFEFWNGCFKRES